MFLGKLKSCVYYDLLNQVAALHEYHNVLVKMDRNDIHADIYYIEDHNKEPDHPLL